MVHQRGGGGEEEEERERKREKEERKEDKEVIQIDCDSAKREREKDKKKDGREKKGGFLFLSGKGGMKGNFTFSCVFRILLRFQYFQTASSYWPSRAASKDKDV